MKIFIFILYILASCKGDSQKTLPLDQQAAERGNKPSETVKKSIGTEQALANEEANISLQTPGVETPAANVTPEPEPNQANYIRSCRVVTEEGAYCIEAEGSRSLKFCAGEISKAECNRSLYSSQCTRQLAPAEIEVFLIFLTDTIKNLSLCTG